MKGLAFRLEHIETGSVLIDEISPHELALLQSKIPDVGSKKITISGKDCRILKISNDSHRLFALATDADRVKSNRLIRSESEVMLAAAKNIEKEIQIARERAESQTKRLIHNLKSLTAKTAQEIYYIALQDKLMASPKESLNYLERQVIDNPRDTAKALLEILKYQTAQKTEFSAFHKLNGNIGLIKKEPHKVHKVLMNIFYLFFNDFTDKKVQVDIQPSELQALFDYDSIHVCTYHIVENAAKYIKSGGEFSVRVAKRGSAIDIIFEMESLLIESKEAEKIFEENYSGVLACKRELQGNGIGLFLAKRMAMMNGGDLVVLNGIASRPATDYARNKFTLSLPCVA